MKKSVKIVAWIWAGLFSAYLTIVGLVFLASHPALIRWDKVPIVSVFFTLNMQRSFGVDVSRFTEPITWDQIETEPVVEWRIWDKRRDVFWFDHLTPYTLQLLKHHMKKNSLGIVPGKYVFETTNTFEEVLEILEFVPVEE